MARRRTYRITGVVTTSGITPATVVTHTMAAPSAATYLAEVSIIGRETTTGDLATAKIGAAFKWDGEGAASQIGAATNILALIASASLATCVVTIDNSGASIRVRVTGVALTGIEWYAELKVYEN